MCDCETICRVSSLDSSSYLSFFDLSQSSQQFEMLSVLTVVKLCSWSRFATTSNLLAWDSSQSKNQILLTYYCSATQSLERQRDRDYRERETRDKETERHSKRELLLQMVVLLQERLSSIPSDCLPASTTYLPRPTNKTKKKRNHGGEKEDHGDGQDDHVSIQPPECCCLPALLFFGLLSRQREIQI